MEIDRSMSELDETRILSQDKGVAVELEVTAEASQHSNLSGSISEEKKVPIAVRECAGPVKNSRNETPKVEKMDEVRNEAEELSALKNDTRKRRSEKEVEPVLQRILSNEPSCSSDLIRITKDQFKIGRMVGNDEVIVSVYISRNHCIIQQDTKTGNWSVTNLSSTDTLLNGKPIARNNTEPIKHDDILQLSLSDQFKYKFILVDKKPESAKCSRLESSDNSLGDVLYRQRSFVERQKNERNDLEKQLADKQQEQEQLKEELDQLLEDQKLTKESNEELNNQIVELRKKIDLGNTTETELQQKYCVLSEKFEEERLKFEEKLAVEKQKWQEELNASKQEKEKMKMTYAEQMEEMKEQLVKKQQEEWQKKVENLLQEEKNVQTKLQSEKQLLEQRLKIMEEDVKKKEHANKVEEQLHKNLQKMQKKVQLLQQMQQLRKVLVSKPNENHILVQVKKNAQKVPVLETIDLTKSPNCPSTSSTSQKNGQDKAVIDKVNNIMDEQLTCSICSELFIRAMTLNCMHTFCRHCIEAWSKKRRECPNCRAAIVSMTRSLVVDNFIEKMLESFTPEQMQKRKQLVEERQRMSKPKEISRKGCRRR